jgi:hypothetical protein
MSNVHLPVLPDVLGTITKDGHRHLVVVADVRGRFHRARKLVFVGLIALWAALPWIHINGAPAVFLDVEARRFFLFGMTFNAQDSWLLFFVLSGAGFGLVYVTALAGREMPGPSRWSRPHERLQNKSFTRSLLFSSRTSSSHISSRYRVHLRWCARALLRIRKRSYGLPRSRSFSTGTSHGFASNSASSCVLTVDCSPCCSTKIRSSSDTTQNVGSHAERRTQRTSVIASTADAASSCVRPASTFATDCRWTVSLARRASTRAMMSWIT